MLWRLELQLDILGLRLLLYLGRGSVTDGYTEVGSASIKRKLAQTLCYLPCPFGSLLAPTCSSPAEISNTTSLLTLVFQSASVNISCPVPPTKTVVGFFRRSCDCAYLETSPRIDEAAARSFDAEAGMMTDALCDCLAFRAMVTRSRHVCMAVGPRRLMG